MSAAVECGGETRAAPGTGPRRLRNHLHWVLPAALLPLAFALGRPDDDTPDRFRRTLAAAPAEARRLVSLAEHDPDATLDDVLAALPGRRIEGAFLLAAYGAYIAAAILVS